MTTRTDGTVGPALPLGTAGLICGRLRGEILFSNDLTVSPEHARFTIRDDVPTAEDLGSVNGTFIRLRSPRTLTEGDEFRVGRQLLRLEAMPSKTEVGARAWGSVDPGYVMRLEQILEGGTPGEVFLLRKGENTIGRETSDITFPSDRYVSARHARIDVADGGIVLIDVGSSNGTFFRITGPTPLTRGDQLLVGMQLLRLEQ